MTYVVTALDKTKHNKRCDISKPFENKKRAESFIKQYKKDYKDALPKYKTLYQFKIEKRNRC